MKFCNVNVRTVILFVLFVLEIEAKVRERSRFKDLRLACKPEAREVAFSVDFTSIQCRYLST